MKPSSKWRSPLRWIVYARGEEVYGLPASLADIGARLASYPREAATLVLATLGACFDSDRTEGWLEAEKRVRPALLRESIRFKVEECRKVPHLPIVAFCRPQVLLALRLVQRFSPSTDRYEMSGSELLDFGEDLLRVTDLLPTHLAPVESVDEATALLPLFDEANTPHLIFAIKRTYDMITDQLWTTVPLLKRAAAIFENQIGLTIPDFLHLLLLPLATLRARTLPNASPRMDWGSILENATDRKAIQRALDWISIGFAELPNVTPIPALLAADPSNEPFRSRPLINCGSARYIVSDVTLLRERLRGIFWMIKEMLPQTEQGDFLSWRGKLFERFVHDRLRPLFGDSYRESPLDRDGNEITDAIVDYGNQVAILEFKDSILREETKFGLDPAAISDAIERRFLGDGQLVRALRRLLGPGGRSPGILTDERPRKIFPVLICHDHAVSSIERFVGDRLMESIARERPPSYRNLQRLTVMTADDIERIGYFVHRRRRKLSTVLGERFRVDPEARITFHDHMYRLAPDLPLREIAEKEDFIGAFDGARAFWARQGPPNLMTIGDW